MPEDQDVVSKGDDGIKALVGEIKDLVKTGDASALQAKLVDLMADNATLRSGRRQLKKQLETAQANSKLPEGSVTLTADEAKDWEEYRKLGKPSVFKDGLTAISEREQARADAALDRAAGAMGYRSILFKALVKAGGLKVVTEDGPEKDSDGKPVPVCSVVTGDTKEPLADYAQAHWGDDLPALLLADTDIDRPVPPRPGGSPSPRRGQHLPPPGANTADELIRQQAALVNYGGRF